MIGLIAGVVASVIHVLSGPDHLAAVTPLAIDRRQRSWSIGLLWGIGHTAGMMILGLLFFLLKNLIPLSKISSHSEILIGILLIAIGSWAILRVIHQHPGRKHIHPHLHLGAHPSFHMHWHSHETVAGHAHEHARVASKNSLAALFVGIVHGISGFSHLIAILPVLALSGKAEILYYLGGFAAGTILTMVTISFILGMIAYRASIKERVKFLYGFSLSAGILAIGTGVLWVIRSF
jgi:hypothetical protein